MLDRARRPYRGAMSRRDPQEKKALSYALDGRNAYGENDKSSRRNIRRNKRFPNRADRHRERQLLAGAAGPLGVDDVEAAERTEERLGAKRSMWDTKRWRKGADAALGDVVAYRLERRARLGMLDPGLAEARIGRIRSRARLRQPRRRTL